MSKHLSCLLFILHSLTDYYSIPILISMLLLLFNSYLCNHAFTYCYIICWIYFSIICFTHSLLVKNKEGSGQTELLTGTILRDYKGFLCRYKIFFFMLLVAQYLCWNLSLHAFKYVN